MKPKEARKRGKRKTKQEVTRNKVSKWGWEAHSAYWIQTGLSQRAQIRNHSGTTAVLNVEYAIFTACMGPKAYRAEFLKTRHYPVWAICDCT